MYNTNYLTIIIFFSKNTKLNGIYLYRNGFVINLYAVEVGTRGILAKSLYNVLKNLGLSRTVVGSILERTPKAASRFLPNLNGQREKHE